MTAEAIRQLQSSLGTDLTAEDLQRMVEHPERILIAMGGPPPQEMTIDIQDADHHQTLIHLERPPALPAG